MNALVLMIALPLAGAFLLPLGGRNVARWGGPLLLAVSAALGLSLACRIAAASAVVTLGGFAPPLGIVLYADPLAMLFALAITLGALLLWPFSAEGEGAPRQWSLTLILAAAGSGIALSGDLFNIYVFYELLAVASYGLVASRGTVAASAAALRYLVVSATGASLALAGIALIYQAAGTLNLAHLAELAPERLSGMQGLAAFVLMLVGFGVKAELFPVNGWVPEVYATATSRVSALLAGVVSKLALLVVLRLLVLLFPQAEMHLLLLVLGIIGVVSGELAAWRATEMRRLLAFSSIGQLGAIFIALSLPGKAGLLAALALALHHLIVKPALFLLAERWGGSLAALAGGARVSPLGAALFILLSLSIIGVPPLPGFWAKLLVLLELFRQGGGLYHLGAAVLLAGAALEANYLFRVATALYHPQQGRPLPATHGKQELTAAGLLGALLLAGMVLIVPLTHQLETIATTASDVRGYIGTVLPAAETQQASISGGEQ